MENIVWTSGEMDTLIAILQRAVARNPDHEFIDFLGDSYTLSRFDAESQNLARGLVALGVKPGDTVTMLLDNNADSVLLLFAITRIGGICVPVNTAYKGEFLRHQIAESGSRIVIAEHDYAERVLAVADGLPELSALLYRGPEVSLGSGKFLVEHLDRHRIADGEDPTIAVQPSDLALLIFTGGTTGPSKACMVSHNYACNLASDIATVNDMSADDVIWTPLPIFHMNIITATIVSTLLRGGKAFIYPRFSLSNFWPEVERSKATIVQLMGAMMPLIADADETDAMKRCYGQIRIASGAPFPPVLVDRWKDRFGIKYGGTTAFGLTEASLLTCWPAHLERPAGSSGKRNPCFDVRIVDENDNELGPDAPGEIIARPLKPLVMFSGYWKRPNETLTVLRDLWFRTGDIGKFDKDGFFYFVDRKKDYLRRRGENISSYEMETAFREHPAIADVAVHAVLSEYTEDDVKMTAVLKEGYDVTVLDLCEWSFINIPNFAVPRYFELRSDLPRNPVGRVLKYQLRDEGVTSNTFDREKAGLKPPKR